MKQSILKALARVKSHEFTKEFKNFEFETKFDLTKRVKLNASNFLRKIEKRFTAGSNFILCKVRGGDKLVTKVAFFAKGNVEYSFFKYRGARMLKVKKHKIIKGIPFNIFKNVEQLLIDKEDFAKKLSRFRRRFRKHKYFLVDVKEKIKRLISYVSEEIENLLNINEISLI